MSTTPTRLELSRWKAAGIHLCISVVVAAIATALLLGIWYPPPYFRAGGAPRLLMLVVLVDVCIGPLLTLIVFKSGKPGLKFDLAVIALLQATALVYGFHVLVSSRPVFMVAAVDRFVLVDADQIAKADLARASRPEWRHLSWTGPVLVAAELPKDPEARNDLLFGSLRAGKDVQDYPQYYVPYETAAPGLLKRAHSIAMLRELNSGRGKEITAWLARHKLAESQVVWLPIQPREGDLVMMMDAATGKPLGALPLIAWVVDKPKSATGEKTDDGQPGKATSTAAPATAETPGR